MIRRVCLVLVSILVLLSGNLMSEAKSRRTKADRKARRQQIRQIRKQYQAQIRALRQQGVNVEEIKAQRQKLRAALQQMLPQAKRTKGSLDAQCDGRPPLKDGLAAIREWWKTHCRPKRGRKTKK